MFRGADFATFFRPKLKEAPEQDGYGPPKRDQHGRNRDSRFDRDVTLAGDAALHVPYASHIPAKRSEECAGETRSENYLRDPMVNGGALGSIMEDNAQGMALAGQEPADAMAHFDLIVAARALDRAIVDGKDHAIAFG